MHTLIENNRARILALADRHGVRNVRIFGSMARGDADDTSDIDLPVSLRPDNMGLALGGLPMDVQDLLQRREERQPCRTDRLGEIELHFPPHRGAGTRTDLSTPMEHDMPRKAKTPEIGRAS